MTRSAKSSEMRPRKSSAFNKDLTPSAGLRRERDNRDGKSRNKKVRKGGRHNPDGTRISRFGAALDWSASKIQ